MRYYKVIKENFLWEVGGIISNEKDSSGYVPIDELYKKHEGNEYITSTIIENCPEYFQRVYKVNLVTQTVYEVKEKAMELLSKSYKQ